MPNSFNISVKPEIAALEAKVDIVDTVVDFTKTYAIAILDDTSVIVPKLPTNYIMGSSVITDKDDEIDSIKERTDNLPDDPASEVTAALPQNVRGKPFNVFATTSESTFQTLCNITGHGKLLILSIYCIDSADTVEIRITIDDVTFTTSTFTGTTTQQSVLLWAIAHDPLSFKVLPLPQTEMRLIDIEYSTSLLVEYRRSAGTAAAVGAKVTYLLDSF